MRLLQIVAVSVLSLQLIACQGMTNEQQGGLFGAGGGALLGGLVGHSVAGKKGSGTATILGAGIGAVGGYFLASSIGARLDAQSRGKAQSATEQVLSDEDKPLHRKRKWKKSSTDDASDNTHGSSEVIKVDPQPSGGECRTVREIAYVPNPETGKGEEVTQNSRYCRSASGDWEPRKT